MRVFPSGRGLPPPMTANLVHLWPFDESTDVANAVDIVGGEDLSQSSNPAQITGWVGPGARSGDGSADYFYGSTTGGADETTMLDDFSVVMAFRADGAVAADGVILYYGGTPATETEAHNALFAVKWVNASHKLQVYWEKDAGTDVAPAAFTRVFEEETWYLIGFNVSVAGGTRTVEMFVNGSSYGSVTGDNATSSSGVQVWRALSDGTSFFKGDLSVGAFYSEPLTDAEHATLFRRAMQWDTQTQVRYRVQIKNSGGSYVDLTNHAGVDWLNSVQYSDSVDNLVQQASFRTVKESFDLSLGKYINNKLNVTPFPSTANPGPDDVTYNSPTSGSSSELLELNRDFKVEVARTPLEVPPAAADWHMVHHGYVDDVDWAGDECEVRGRDLGSVLLMAYFEDEGLTYSSGSTDTLDEVIDAMLTSGDTNNWYAGAAPTLYLFPFGFDPDWVVREFDQERVPMLTGISDLAYQGGAAVCRYKWSDEQADFVLTLWRPDRDKTCPDAVLSTNEYIKFRKIGISRANIRNAIRIAFRTNEAAASSSYTGAQGGVNEDNVEVPATVTINCNGTDNTAWPSPLDTDSISLYGRQFCEIGEVSATNIDSYDEADLLAENVMKDLMLPLAEASLDLFAMPELEVGDLLTLPADNKHFTSDLTLAITRLSQKFDRNGARTSVDLRCRPSGGHKKHLERETRTNGAMPPVIGPGDFRAGRGARALNQERSRRGQATQLNRVAEPIAGASVIANPYFSRRTFGLNQPPDGWAMEAGTWGSAGNAYLDVTDTYAVTGNASLMLNDDTAKVVGEMMAVPDGHTVEARASVITSAGTFNCYVELEYYNAAKTKIGSKATLESCSTTRTEIAIFEKVTSSTKFIRVLLYRAASVGNVAYYDRVHLTVKKPGFHAYNEDNADDATALVAQTWTQIRTDSEAFDYNDNYDKDGTPAASTFTAPVNGRYIFSAMVKVELDADGDRVMLGLYKNGALWITGPSTTNAAGDPGGTYPAYPALSTGPVDVAKGDVITLWGFNDHATNNADVEAGEDVSFWTGRLVAIE